MRIYLVFYILLLKKALLNVIKNIKDNTKPLELIIEYKVKVILNY
jgi:hypothetical protein